jgi:ADP-ribosylglycohydrolase
MHAKDRQTRLFEALERWEGAHDVRGRFRGCLLGGAIGDALGAPVEFLRHAEIVAQHGPLGLTDLAPAYGRIGAITDDTQMTLFTAEALLRLRVANLLGIPADPATLACGAYLRWRYTQDEAYAGTACDGAGLLLRVAALHARRGPGATCLESLESRAGASGDPAVNDRKGCGGVMRMAPVGLAFVDGNGARISQAFDRGVLFAALTHGHPSGSLAAGAFAMIESVIAIGAPLEVGLDKAIRYLRGFDGHQETLAALINARRLADEDAIPGAASVESLGGGWVAEEALAIGVYAALVAETFADGVLLAVNHGGDSDSTGAIAGNLLGTLHGIDAIPSTWRERVELGDLLLQVADDLYEAPAWTREDAERMAERYPPG